LDDQIAFMRQLLLEVARNPDHQKLVPIFQTFYAQIHTLKLVYMKFRPYILKHWTLKNRVLLWLVASELAKLHVRYYLIEEKVWTENREILSWVQVLDWIFDDFRDSHDFEEAWLWGIWDQIWTIRNRIAEQKYHKRAAQREADRIIWVWRGRR
jgi:hypothetical protein